MEKTFVMIKPDGIRRGLVGNIITRYEQKGLKITALKLMQVSEELAKKHYAEHVSKPFFPELIAYLTSGPVIAMVLEGPNAIKLARLINGATKVEDAMPGTIRGDYATSTTENLVHAADSPESATREIALWFPDLK
ncbi:MAG TPA: nucleoside-diphosphate kinase [Thermoanaerobacterales bacterium]|uniref:nucleoside-diphosphate kinase n=1 Tax=Tepidanaerobacter sp. GT38 TaxID=2722793 RepID=UPI00182F59FE|nr:nucleoside-diphosphate kinase [Tepidanaerobacter sp. GT38]MCG1011936.1 nucleoside-diphosphate kinase [Tepidanaerobacter sp. GT38]HHY41233.1 nucleoside-diphosphate kinase [Thermoanaerobacterales bacterium]